MYHGVFNYEEGGGDGGEKRDLLDVSISVLS